MVQAALVFVVVPLLWMGAQVTREERLSAIQRVLPSSLDTEEASATVQYVSEVLDATYDAVEGTKQAAFLWGKVCSVQGLLQIQIRVGSHVL
jgi:hypothetical protein